MHLKWIGRMAIILGLFLTVAVSAKAAEKDDSLYLELYL